MSRATRAEQSRTSRADRHSIAGTVERLALWSRRAPKGLARIEYPSEPTREQVIVQLRDALDKDGISVNEIVLPVNTDPVDVVRHLYDALANVSSGVVSISGFSAAFPDGENFAQSLRVLNFNRDKLAQFPLRQVWWMYPSFAEPLLRVAPDLSSWFIVRHRITEIVAPERDIASEIPSPAATIVGIEEARRRADRLVRRFRNALEKGFSEWELVESALGAVDTLRKTGAILEARELLDRLCNELPDKESEFLRTLRSGQIAEETEQVANALSIIGFLYHDEGRYVEAETLLRRTLAIRERTLGPDNSETAASLNNLAQLLNLQSLYAEAEQLFRRALAITEKLLGSEHPFTATCLNNLAGLLENQGRHVEAEPLFRRALAIREKALGFEHPDTAGSLNNLADLLRVQGRYSEAEPLLRRALAIKEMTLGPEHPDTAMFLNNLAVLLGSQNRFSEAESILQRAVQIKEKMLGPDHPSTATSLSRLGALFEKQGKFVEAFSLQKRALEIRERMLGPEHPVTATSLNNLAGLLKNQARFAEAEPLLQRALTITEKTLAPGHPDIALVAGNLATILRALNRISEAAELEARAAAIRAKHAERERRIREGLPPENEPPPTS